MATIKIETGTASKTTTGVERALDVTVDLTVGRAHVSGDVTLLPAEDGRPCYERWGVLDNWMDGRLIRALEALEKDTRSETINAIEAAAAAKCGRP